MGKLQYPSIRSTDTFIFDMVDIIKDFIAFVNKMPPAARGSF
jgi:hypothetical protein